MSKSLFPSPYNGGESPFSALQTEPEKQERGLDWRDMYQLREQAANRPDVEPFPLSLHGEWELKRLKEQRPDFFASMREENLWRLFSYFRERFEIFEADCRDFEKFWFAMDKGRDLWAWAESIEGAHSMHRMNDFEHITRLMVYPLREVQETAKQMRDKMAMYFEAQAAFIRLSKSLAELEDEHRRRYAKQG